MRIRIRKFTTKLPLGSIALNIIFGIACLPSIAVTEFPNQAEEVTKATTNIKTRIPRPSDKKPKDFVVEMERSQSLRPIGLEPVRPVELPAMSPNLSGRITIENDDASVSLNRPPLQALISVQENLNPFSMDALYAEHVSLADALKCAVSQNLAKLNRCVSVVAWIRSSFQEGTIKMSLGPKLCVAPLISAWPEPSRQT